MKKIHQHHIAKVVILYVLMVTTILISFLISPQISSQNGFSMQNPANLIHAIFFAICSSWQYLLLKLQKKARNIVWVFPVIGLIIVIILWVAISIDQPSDYPATFGLRFNRFNREGDLLFMYSFLSPSLLSSCISGWAIAPTPFGKKVSITSTVLLSAIIIHITVLSGNALILFAIIPLIIMVFLYHRSTKIV